MFRPMAWTVVFALAGSLLLTLTLTPVLASLFLRKTGHEHEPRFVGWLRGRYLRALDACFSRRAWVLAGGLRRRRGRGRPRHAARRRVHPPARRGRPLGLRDPPARRWGSRRWPRAPDGSSACSSGSRRSVTVVSRSGSPELATDVMGIELSDVFVILKPGREWTTRSDQGRAGGEDERGGAESVPGIGTSFTQPIEMRFNELIAGVPLGRGGQALRRRPRDAAPEGRRDRAAWWRGVPGAADVEARADGRPAGAPRPRRPRPLRALRHLGGRRARHRRGGPRREGRRDGLRGPAPLLAGGAVRRRGGPDPRRPRRTSRSRRRSGASVPLASSRQITLDDGPAQISRETVRRRIVVEANVRGRDVASFVAEARERLAPRGEAPDRLLHPLGRPVREPEAASRRAGGRRAPGPRADLRDAVLHLRLA